MSITYADKQVIDAARLYQDCNNATPKIPVDLWYNRANLFDVPRGELPGRGAILLNKKDLDAIEKNTSHTLRFKDDVSDQVILLQEISITGATCVVPGAESEEDNIYLVELQDKRYELVKVPISKAYNLVNGDGTEYLKVTMYQPPPASGVTPPLRAWTWQEMFKDIWDLLFPSTTAPTLPFTPHGTPENFDFYDSFAWTALNYFLDRIACTIVHDATDSTFTIYRLGTTTSQTGKDAVDGTTTDAALTCWDEYPVRVDRGLRPQKIRVLFARYPGPNDGSDPYYAKDITLSAPTAPESVIAGSYITLEDDMVALGPVGTPSNDSVLQARAQERADDWKRKYENSEKPFVRQYRGWRYRLVKALGPKYASIGYEDRGAGFRSQIISGPTVDRFRARLPTRDEKNRLSGSGDGALFTVKLEDVVISDGTTCRRVDFTLTSPVRITVIINDKGVLS